jgi:hypothetical protein
MHPVPTPAASRARVALHCADLSAFAKSLRAQLIEHHAQEASPPGHQSLLNMLARAAGHRNLQALMAQASPAAPEGPLADAPPNAALGGHSGPPQADAGADPWADADSRHLPLADESGPAAPTPLSPNAAKALTQFDAWGRLSRWPHKFSVQRLAMWALWTRFEAGRRYRERDVNAILKAWTTWGDHVTPRRELVEMGLLGRESDCSAYWKCAQQPNEDVRALLRALRARRPTSG